MTTGSQDARADEILVRSTWHAAKVPGHESPYDVAHVKVYYPATADSSDDAKQSGEMAADLAAGPLPVVVFASGVNCSQDAYRWLAIDLVKAGFVAVSPVPCASATPSANTAASGTRSAASVRGTRRNRIRRSARGRHRRRSWDRRCRG